MFGADRELMDEWIWLLMAIGAAVIFLALILLRTKKERTKENYAFLTLGLTLIVLGIIFGDDPLIGYSFIGVGVLLSIISAIRSRSKRMKHRQQIEACFVCTMRPAHAKRLLELLSC